jgi:hypothetical protein
MTASRWPWWASLYALRAVVLASLVSTACATRGPAPFTNAETERALAPTRDLRERCYAGTALERAGRTAVLDYELNVEPDGRVRSVPVRVEPEIPVLVECVRARLNQLKFPAKGRDRLKLHFELAPDAVRRREEPPQLGTCDPPCAEGFSCHYEPSHAAKGVCRVETGRCRFDLDCAPSQACQRRTERLGICAERGP